MRLFVSFFLLSIILPNPAAAQPLPPEKGFEVWVTNQQRDSIQILNGLTLEVMNEILLDADGKPATTKPHSMAISPDGNYALTANIGVKSGTKNISVIRTKDRKVIQTLPAGPAAHMVVFAPDGKRAFAANAGGSSVTEIRIDPEKGKFSPGRTLKVPLEGGKAHPTCLSVSADSQTLFVTNAGPKAADPNKSGFVSIMDIDTGKEVKRITGLGNEVCAQGMGAGGKALYLTIGGGVGNFGVMDPLKHQLTHQKTAEGGDPHGLAAAPNGTIWVTNRLSNSVSEYSGGDYKAIRTIKNIGDKPDLIVLSPGGSRAFITLRGTPATPIPGKKGGSQPGISVIDLKAGKIMKRITLGGDPHGIAIRELF
ncbi:MAG TPA: hypothetical protein VIU33_01200 [Nitrospiria bacterium]